MNKLTFFLCTMLLCIFAGCDKDDPTWEKPQILLDYESLDLEDGESLRLVASFIPEDTENRAHAWTSENPEIATVDETGLVEAVSPGKTKITAKALAGGKKATCIVTVTPKPVEGVRLNHKELDLLIYTTEQLTAIITPSAATNKDVRWESSNPSIAKVSSEGIVEGIKLGSATITVTTVDGNKTAQCVVNVVDKIINAPYTLSTGGGIEFDACPFGLGYLEVTSPGNGRWHTGKDYSWQCTATYSYSRADKTSATFTSYAYQSITGRSWRITATLIFTESDSGTATYTAVAPSDVKSGTTKFKIYTYYPTPS